MRPVRKRACAANQKSALGAGEQPLALPGALPSERLDQKKREVLVRVGGTVLSGRVLKRLRAAAQRKELPGRSARLRGNGAFAGLQGAQDARRRRAETAQSRPGQLPAGEPQASRGARLRPRRAAPAASGFLQACGTRASGQRLRAASEPHLGALRPEVCGRRRAAVRRGGARQGPAGTRWAFPCLVGPSQASRKKDHRKVYRSAPECPPAGETAPGLDALQGELSMSELAVRETQRLKKLLRR